MRTATVHYPQLIEASVATKLYNYLKDNIEWKDGVKSKNGFTRKAAPMMPGIDEEIDEILSTVFSLIKLPENLQLLGIYLNYYRDGHDYTPNHSHAKQVQVIISLGATRTLTVGKKIYQLQNGDVMVFGSSVHGIPKEPEIKEGRISIATFMLKSQ